MRRMAVDSRQESSVQNSRMNWAIGQGSNGGRLARSCGNCRSSKRTSSLLQSQKLDSNSRSSSGVRRSDENVVRAGVSVKVSPATDDRFFLADFILVFLPLWGSNNPVWQHKREDGSPLAGQSGWRVQKLPQPGASAARV